MIAEDQVTRETVGKLAVPRKTARAERGAVEPGTAAVPAAWASHLASDRRSLTADSTDERGWDGTSSLRQTGGTRRPAGTGLAAEKRGSRCRSNRVICDRVFPSVISAPSAVKSGGRDLGSE